MFATPKNLDKAVLFVSTDPLSCRSGLEAPIRTWQPQTGTYRGKTIYGYETDPSCLSEGADGHAK
jgi:hypothetical protein